MENIQLGIDNIPNNLYFLIIRIIGIFNSPLLFIYFALTIVILFIITLVQLIIRLLLIKHKLKQKYTFLEVKPLWDTLQSPYTTQQLFSLIHSLSKHQTWLQNLIGNQKNYSFEIVSSKNNGIRYFLRVNEEDEDVIKKGLLSYLPDVNVKKTNDYLLTSFKQTETTVTEFVLSNHFAFPLKRQNDLKEHDPIAYITGSMTKLSSNEVMAFQLVSSPLNKKQIKNIKQISHLIYDNNDLVEGLKRKGRKTPFFTMIEFVLQILMNIIILPIGLVVYIASGSKEGPFLPLSYIKTKKKTPNPYQEELEILVKAKLDQPLFNTSIRLLVLGNKTQSTKRIKSFSSSLSSFANSYQSVRISNVVRLHLLQKINQFAFQHRLLSFFNNSTLSISEVSDLYHFPYTRTTKTENLSKLFSRELPAPLSLKQKEASDIYFAKNTYGGTETKIGLTQEERRRHVYMLGATGTGKSTILLSMVKQDIEHNKGLCVIDPHGDLIDQILSVIPNKRMTDVVYFNPDDISFPIGINLLEFTPGLGSEEAVREKEFIAESIISVFHKIFSEKYSGPRMEYILRNTIHTAFTVPDATLFTIYKLLINSYYRMGVIRGLTDENLIDFWKYEFTKAGDYQKVTMISPITNKIGRFLFSPIAKRILEQNKSTINFDTILNEGKILLCNLSKGKIGEDNSEVFGVLIMAKIQQAALKRARMKQEDRRDFYLYVDEFQNFATPAFSQILSEARKYRLNAILAHQTTSQIEDTSLVNVTLANTGTVICFRTANPEDERMILPQFRPYIEQGEIANLPSYHFYMRLGALNPEEPFSGVTVPVQIQFSQNRVDDVIESSRKLYAKKWVNVTIPIKTTIKTEEKPVRSSTQPPKVLLKI